MPKIDVSLENIESNTGVLAGDLSFKTQSNSMFTKGDILFGRLRPYLNKWWFATVDGVKSNEIWALIPLDGNSPYFIFVIVQSKAFLQATYLSSGTKMPRAEWGYVSNTKIKIPALDEQIVIGHFFETMNNLITLHQRTFR